MTFANLLTAVTDNLIMGGEEIAVLLVVLGSLIFFAKDFKIGMIVLMTTSAGLFVWFYEKNFNYTLPLLIFFMTVVILALSLFAVNKSSATGGFT